MTELGSIIDPNWKARNNSNFNYGKMVTYDNQAKSDSKQKTLIKGEKVIEELANEIGLNDINITSIQNSNNIKDEAFHYFKKIRGAGDLIGRSIKLGATVALFYSCSLHDIKVNVSIEEIMKSSNPYVEINQLRRFYDLCVKKLQGKFYIEEIFNELNLSSALRTQILYEIDRYKSYELHLGKKPSVFAVAVIYLVLKNEGARITQTLLSKVSGISRKSISITYNYLQCYHL